jgi:hypothetical protein
MAVFSSPSFADHGGCPCKSETVLRNQNHVADTLDVFEPAQRAIVIWDGETETIILSTDVRLAGASQSGLIAEFIPLTDDARGIERGIEIQISSQLDIATSRAICQMRSTRRPALLGGRKRGAVVIRSTALHLYHEN